MISAIHRTYGNTIEITLTLSWSDVQNTYKEIVEKLSQQIEIPGFRKGKAPTEVLNKHLDQAKIYEEVLKKILPQVYTKVVQEENLKPIISPKIEVLEAKKGGDWKILIKICERPVVNLGNYRTAIQKIIHNRKPKIWLPDTKKPQDNKEPTVEEILDALYSEIKVELSPLLVEQEINRQLTHTYDELKKLGLTVEQYLQAKNKTSDILYEETKTQSTKNLTIEFALENIADKENVIVNDNEIDEFLNNLKSDSERQTLQKERYFLTSVIRRQKTLQLLLKPSIITNKTYSQLNQA